MERRWIGGACPKAGELIAVVQAAMLNDEQCLVLRDAILTHPTLAKGLNELQADVDER